MKFWLVWHRGTPKDLTVDLVYASTEEEAAEKTGYDSIFAVEAIDANDNARALFTQVTNSGRKAARQGEIIRIDEWHLN